MDPIDAHSFICALKNRNSVDTLRSLYQRGADPNEPDHSGTYPIHQVYLNNDTSLFPIFIDEFKVNLNAKNDKGNTVLAMIIKDPEPNENLIKYLLSSGADPNIPNCQGRTPLHIAAFNCFHNIIKILLQFGADPNQLDSEGSTPLMEYLCYNDDDDLPELLELFLQKGANPNLHNSKMIPIMLYWNNLTLIELLLKYGANPFVRDKYGETFWIKLVKNSNQERVINILQKYKINLNETDYHRLTLLMTAIAYHRSKIARFLIESGSDVNQRDLRDKTALYYAANHCPELIHLLLLHGANPNQVALPERNPLRKEDLSQITLQRRTALSVLQSSKHNVEIKLLLNYGADPRDLQQKEVFQNIIDNIQTQKELHRILLTQTPLASMEFLSRPDSIRSRILESKYHRVFEKYPAMMKHLGIISDNYDFRIAHFQKDLALCYF